jgi:hypothetical protein
MKLNGIYMQMPIIENFKSDLEEDRNERGQCQIVQINTKRKKNEKCLKGTKKRQNTEGNV